MRLAESRGPLVALPYRAVAWGPIPLQAPSTMRIHPLCLLLCLALWTPFPKLVAASGTASATTRPASVLLQDDQDDAGDAGQDSDDQDADNDAGETPTAGADYSSWSWWWNLNREPLLDLRAQLGLNDASGASIPGLTPSSMPTPQSWSARPSDAVVRGEILPALFQALEGRSSRIVTTSVLIALARLGEDQSGDDRAQVLESLRPHLKDKDQLVVEAAIMALGILGNESACGLLSELMLDTSFGQRLVGDSRVRTRSRAIAAYSIGLLGARTQREDVRRYAVYMLARALEKDKTSTPDLGVACVRAIGMTPLNWSGASPPAKRSSADPPNSSREAQLGHLLGILQAGELHRQVLAFIPTAIAQLLSAETTPPTGALRASMTQALLESYEATRRTDREVRRSIAIALGLIGSSGDPELDERMVRALMASERDRITQNWSLLALGRCAAAQPAQRARVRRSLLQTLKRKSGDDAEWAALALGLLEREARATDPAPEVAQALIQRLRRTNRLTEVGALCLGLGLCGEPLAGEVLAKRLNTVEDPETLGYVALSLALLGAADQLQDLHEILGKAENKPLLLRDSATAVAMLGDQSVIDRLLQMLESSHSVNAQASLAQALGRMGGSSSVGPLIQMLANSKATENSRAYAAVALGLVADRDRLPWNTLISLDINASAAPPTLMDFDGHGILNIL